MHNTDINRVVFHSREDMAGAYNLQKGEHILRADTKSNYSDINEVLELYNLKKYIDNNLYLKNWTKDDISDFKKKATEYGKVVGQFMATISDNNVVGVYGSILRIYVHSFWELVNNQSIYKRISKTNFSTILSNEPHFIHEILAHNPNSAIEFLISPADVPKHDRKSESGQKAVDLMTCMCITLLFSVLRVHFSFLMTSLSFPQ